MREETGPSRSFLLPGTALLCASSILTAVLALVGWLLHRNDLVGLHPGAVTMKPNTAISVALLGFATLGQLRTRRSPFWVPLLCWATLALGAATLAEYLTGSNLGIDQLILQVPPDSSGDPLGRMSIGTAIDVVLSSAALLLINLAPATGRLLSAGAGLLSLSALVGMLFDAGPLFGVRLLRSMSLRTAVCFLALQIAYFLMRPLAEPTRSLLITANHHRTGIWFVLATCTLPLFIGWPVAVAYRHASFDAAFAFAILVVSLMAAQTLLVASNSRSLAAVEDRRKRTEIDRQALARENERQYTELVAGEAQAAKSEAQYRLITDALPALVAYLDPDLRYVRINRTYREWFGVAASDVKGKTLDEVLGESAGSVRGPLAAALAGHPQHFETRFQTLQGERTVTVSHQPDFDSEGHIRGVVALVNDVTASKNAEAALRQTEKLAAVGKLASSIAHEINNPLEAITNLLYLAKTSPDVEEIQHYLEIADLEVQRVSAIATQTLKFHRQASRPVATDMEEMLTSVLLMYRSRLMNGQVKVEGRYRRAEPVLCFDGEIRQVLNNLVGNAIDAMQSRPGRLLLRCRPVRGLASGQPGVVITVADTGSGMSPTTQKRLFEAFFTTKEINGTGLGLWVSKDIIDRHQGRLRLRSSQRPGRSGTVFSLFLPCTMD